MTEMLITGGLLVDGTGDEPRQADVLLSEGRIAQVGTIDHAPGTARVIEAVGKVICPGFVDLHTHSDLTLLSNPQAHSAIRQGITTTVIGNCGLGVAPLPTGADRTMIRSAVSYLDLDPAIAWRWDSVGDYFDRLQAVGPSINVASLVGQLPLHAGVVGFDDRPATTAEISTMAGILDAAMSDGAVGLSTGLMYAPLTFASDAELTALAEVVADHGGLFAWHLRDYADQLLPSVQQAIEIGRRTGCRIQLSHLIAVGQRNWGKVAEALRLVDEALQQGVDVAVDVYPYLAGNAPLSQRLPVWAQVGGDEAIRTRLADPGVVVRIAAHWADDALSWAEVTINRAPDAEVQGSTVTELAERAGRTPDEAAIDLLRRYGNAVTMVARGRGEEDLAAVFTHSAAVVGSDGQALDPDGPTGAGVPHPRSYGCYPRFLSDWVGTDRLSLAEAVRKCTSAPARRIGLTDRGVIGAGLAADLVLLDLDRVADLATYEDPQRYPAGIDLVIVNGEVVLDQGRHSASPAGRVLRAAGEMGRGGHRESDRTAEEVR